MALEKVSDNYFLNKSTYVKLRWIGIIGQLSTINIVTFNFNFELNFLFANLIVVLGILSNFFLFFIHKQNQLSNQTSFFYLFIDIIQLSILLYLTGEF